MTVTSTQAANLATTYHVAMVMVKEKTEFYLPAEKSPRDALNDYLKACKACGVRLHNDGWEAEAERVVERLTDERRRYAKSIEIWMNDTKRRKTQ